MTCQQLANPKLSEFIAHLVEQMAQHGDVLVGVKTDHGAYDPIFFTNVRLLNCIDADEEWSDNVDAGKNCETVLTIGY